MNKETMETMITQAEKMRNDILTDNFDEKSSWMLVLTFIIETLKYELDKQKCKKIYT